MHVLSRFSAILLITSFFSAIAALAGTKNGFDLSGALIPENHIFAGGPAKDGIPAIDNPRFVDADAARFMRNNDRILGITIAGVSKAYPVKILNWHEIINDKTGDELFTITFCPLCGTGMAFSSQVNGQNLSFGVSGLLYNSDVLLYDRETESLWSQIMSTAVTGKFKGTKLKPLPLEHTSWGAWKQSHPNTSILSIKTGYWRDYDKSPYAGYEKSEHIMFPVAHKAPDTYHPKERVLGLNINGVSKAYPFIELNKHGKSSFTDVINNTSVNIRWDQQHQAGTVFTTKGQKQLPVTEGFWFAWFAFHPDTLVFHAYSIDKKGL